MCDLNNKVNISIHNLILKMKDIMLITYVYIYINIYIYIYGFKWPQGCFTCLRPTCHTVGKMGKNHSRYIQIGV